MLRGTRENISLLASISNCAGVMALCFLLLATTVVVLPQNLHSSLLQPAYAQQVEEEGEEGTTDTGTGEEGEKGTTDTGTGEEGEEGTTDTGTGEEGEEGTTDTGTGEEQLDDTVVLTNLQRVVELAGVTDPSGLSEIAAASDSDEVAEIAGASDSEALAETPGITSPEAIDAIARVSNLRGLAQLVGLSIDDLLKQVLPEQPPTDEEPLTAEISSNYTATDEHVAPATFSFAANVSGGTGPSTVSWNFGDNSEVSDEQTVSHTYDEAGTYTVTLTATDSEDQTATDTLEIAVAEPVEEPPAPEPLTAEISSNYTATDEHVAPATFSFAANVSGGTGPSTVSWNFGDNSAVSDEESVVHTFNEAGTYTVTLTATDSTGETATDTLEIAVAEEPPAPEPLTAEISSNYTATDEHVAPATFSFAANVSGGTGPSTVSWNFGDNSEVSDEESVAHTFNEAGTYTVTLTATDSEDQTATDTLEIAVAEPVEEPPAPEPLTAEISSNYTATDEHVAPATFSFAANVSGG